MHVSSPHRPSPAGPRRAGARRAAEWCRENVADPLLASVFPPRCVGCGEFETFLCGACRADLRPAGPDRCPRCGHPGVSDGGPGWCPACVGQTPTFTSARSVFLHEGPARRLVTSFKYDGLRVLGREMGALAAEDFSALVDLVRPGVITWVPAHASNTRARGYNQAEVLARELARAHALPALALVNKRRRTDHQRGLDREGRLHNLRGAFVALQGGPQTDTVVLVDDVFTTGATVAEVSRVVSEQAGARVHVFTFSRTRAGFPQRSD